MQAIFSRPPSIAEDTIHYVLHPPESSSDRTSVTVLALSIQNFVESLLPDFLWHRDTFQVKVVQNSDKSGWILEGWMRVGDSIDDEWCVVWLLREVSEKWDCAISARDSDGEFMLIEAADDLPSWVTPSVVENRVWIYRSHLHLIPLSYVSPPSSKGRRVGFSDDNADLIATDGFLNVSDAVKLLRDASASTRASSQVEQTIWQRIAKYPDSLPHHVHRAKAYLPVDIAKALFINPELVQKAVEAFYTRDAVQLRVAHKMARFPPQPCPLRSVRLTRTAYAQLVGQKFYPPKVFGRWQEKEGSPEWRWKDLGMKIACGFEMLYHEGRARDEMSNIGVEGSSAAVRAQKDALQRDPDFIKYVDSIQAAGYFRGEIEGSQLWDALESKALVVFLQSRRKDDASRSSFASQVRAAIANAGDLTPSKDLEDPDDWLTINAEDFDHVLQDNLSRNAPRTSHDEVDVNPHLEHKEHDTTHAQVAKLRELANKVDAFVAGKGDVEGATFEDEQPSDGELSDFSDDDGATEMDSDDNDEESAHATRQEALEKLVPGIEPSEYGRMPSSFYDSSQRVAPAALENEGTAPDTAFSAKETDASFLHTQPRPARAPLLPRDQYDGVDSDDDTDTDEFDGLADGDEQPELVGEVEVDMAEEEEEFLEFSRQALGISDEHWQQILQERRDRGAYIPAHIGDNQHLSSKIRNSDAPVSRTRPRATTEGNPNLDTFEAVMRAMDEELSRSQSQNTSTGAPDLCLGKKGKGKGTSPAQGVEEDMDIEKAMDAELKAALEHDEDDEVDVSAEGGLDYNLIKNFLESFKSQAGSSGPVSNLIYQFAVRYNMYEKNLHDPNPKMITLTDGDACDAGLQNMIRSVIILNTSGVPRLTKFYSPIHQSAQAIVAKIYSLISTRSPGSCNFLEAPELDELLCREGDNEKLRVVYRSYATLHFVFVVDSSESELGILDLIQVFVEALDRAFENVCELDLVFHFDEVHHILAEIIQGGLVLETNLDEIDSAVHQAASARKQSFNSANPLTLSVGGMGPRSTGLQTPLGWLTGKLTGVGAR